MNSSAPIPTDLWAFEGTWLLSREIVDGKGPDGRFEGEAEFVRDGGNLNYIERGTLHLGTASFQAERRYLWSTLGPGEIALHFDDGRFFHSFALNPKAHATHNCPPDWYSVHYYFENWPVWSASWDVTGPRKSYRMNSRYRRP